MDPTLDSVLQALAAGQIDLDEAKKQIAGLNEYVTAENLAEKTFDESLEDSLGPNFEQDETCRQPQESGMKEPDEPGDAKEWESLQKEETGESDSRFSDFDASESSSNFSDSDSGSASDFVQQSPVDFLAESIKHGADSVFGVLRNVMSATTDKAQGASAVIKDVIGGSEEKNIEKLFLRISGRRLKVIGDEKVASVKVSGPHTLRQESNMVEIISEGSLLPDLGELRLHRLVRGVDLKKIGLGKEVVIHVNPNILVDVEATGSSVEIVGVKALGRFRVSASGASVDGVQHVCDGLVQACNLSMNAKFTAGKSKIRVESGSLFLKLDPKSNVTMRSTTQIGRVAWPGAGGANLDEFVLGTGVARLDLAVLMGFAQVRVNQLS